MSIIKKFKLSKCPKCNKDREVFTYNDMRTCRTCFNKSIDKRNGLMCSRCKKVCYYYKFNYQRPLCTGCILIHNIQGLSDYRNEINIDLDSDDDTNKQIKREIKFDSDNKDNIQHVHHELNKQIKRITKLDNLRKIETLITKLWREENDY
jgi:hypothetical protein